MLTFPVNDEHTFLTQCTYLNAKHKMRLDNSNLLFCLSTSFDVFNWVSLCDEEKGNLRNHIMYCGIVAGAFFVHRVSQTNINGCMKFPESITNSLRVPKRGDMFIYAREPDVPEVAQG